MRGDRRPRRRVRAHLQGDAEGRHPEQHVAAEGGVSGTGLPFKQEVARGGDADATL